MYDNDGNLKQLTEPTGNSILIEYGAIGSGLEGLETRVFYPTYSEAFKYDELNRPAQISQTLDSNTSLVSHISYNKLDEVTHIIKPNNSSLIFEYDALGNIIKQIKPLGGETKQAWDIFGNITQVLDAKGNIYTFDYDKNNNLTKETYALGSIIENTYDTANQLIQQNMLMVILLPINMIKLGVK